MTHAKGLGKDDLETLLNLMPMPVLLVAPSGEAVAFANDAARRYPEGSLPIDAAARAARGESVRGLQVQMETADGPRALLVDAELAPDLPGTGTAVIVCFQD